MTYRHLGGIYGGISKYRQPTCRPKGLHTTDRHLHQERQVQWRACWRQHTDGGGMYLLINKAGKYWRMNYRFADKRKTLALGVSAVSLEEPSRGARRPASCWHQA